MNISLLNNPSVPSNVDPNRIKLDVIYDSAVVAKTLTNELNKYLTVSLSCNFFIISNLFIVKSFFKIWIVSFFILLKSSNVFALFLYIQVNTCSALNFFSLFPFCCFDTLGFNSFSL